MNPTPEPGKAIGAEDDANPPTAARAGAAAPQASSPSHATAQPGWVALVGAGPGDEGLLTLRGAQLLAQADMVVASADVAARLRGQLRSGQEVADPAALSGDARAIVKAAKAGQRVVRLYPGDPFMLSPGAEVAAACAKAAVQFEVVPGVPPAAAVPAYAGIPLGSDVDGDVRFVHASEVSHVPASAGALVVLDAETGPADIAKMLIGAGWTEGTPFAVTWNGTTTAQRTVASTLGGIAADLKAAGVSPLTTDGPAVAVAGPPAAEAATLSWFETRPLFGWRVLVPRTKEQAGALSDRLRAHGAVPEEVPTITVEPPRTPQQMERAVKGLVTGRYQWIAFTSVNAVRAVREKFEEYGLDARAFAGVKVAAVGEQTGAALRAFGITPDLRPWWPRSPNWAGRPTMSRPTARSARRRRLPRCGKRSRAAASTRCCSPRRRRYATWSASRANRTRSR